jgi:subtilisin-like proprotein convertase family protein
MDEHSGKGRLWAAGVVVCIFQYSTFATGYYSFGKSVNLSFGADYTKTMLKTDIFVPISGNVLDLNLALDIEHTSVSDLQIYIKSPAETLACINSYDVYNFVPDRKNFYWTIFDAESSVSIDSGSSPFSGLFRPNGPDSLTGFYGQQSFGIWQVWVYDAVFYNTGTFKGARLDFFINPEPATILLFCLGLPFAFSSRKSHCISWRK